MVDVETTTKPDEFMNDELVPVILPENGRWSDVSLLSFAPLALAARAKSSVIS